MVKILIQCTKKLLDQLQVEPEKTEKEKPLFSWHANLKRINHRKTVILVNDYNRYIIVLYGLKADNFKQMGKHIIEATKKTFEKECIKKDLIDEFINFSPNVTYTKTKNRSKVAMMNEGCKFAGYFTEKLIEDSIYQPVLSKYISKRLVGDGQGNYMRPAEEMYGDIKKLTERSSIFGCRAVKIKVTLSLEDYNIWRRLVVPMTITFKQLHEIIQAAFGWKDYHLHEFYIFDEKAVKHNPVELFNRGDIEPVINLVGDEEDLNYSGDVPMKLEKGIEISEYIPVLMIYNYDYGDYWQHSIEVEEIIENYNKNFPICFDGNGNAPPEDVGGEGGFERFLEIIANEDHPEYQIMINWGEKQGYSEFNIDEINRNLKR